MKTTRWLMLGCMLSLWAGQAQAASFLGLFNTGVDDSSVVRADDAAETHYSLVSPSPVTGAPVVATSAGAFPIPPWLADSSASAWITPANNTEGPSGNYTYRISFDLTGFDPTTAEIHGRYSTDNAGGISVNGGASIFPTPFDAFTNWYDFALLDAVPGVAFGSTVNTLDFIVNNISGPSGVRVEFTTVVATPLATPEPGTLLLWGTMAFGLAASGWRRHRRAA